MDDKTDEIKLNYDQLVPIAISPPFLERFAKLKKEKNDKEILKTFRKVWVNIPLYDVIKQVPRYAIKHVPRYAKFLKEL